MMDAIGDRVYALVGYHASSGHKRLHSAALCEIGECG